MTTNRFAQAGPQYIEQGSDSGRGSNNYSSNNNNTGGRGRGVQCGRGVQGGRRVQGGRGVQRGRGIQGGRGWQVNEWQAHGDAVVFHGRGRGTRLNRRQRRIINRYLGPGVDIRIYGSVAEVNSATRREQTLRESISAPTVPDTTQEEVNMERVEGEREVRIAGEGRGEEKGEDHEKEDKRQKEKQTSWW